MRNLPFWHMTTKKPAVHDVDSATVVEQTAKLYGTMQTLIDEHNQFVDEMNKAFVELETDTHQDMEGFKAFITKTMNEYTKSIDTIILGLPEKDAQLESTILGLMGNLGNVYPAIEQLERDVTELKENGGSSGGSSSGGGLKLYKHAVYEMMDTNDPYSPTTTHTIYSFRDTPYTNANEIINDFNKGIITSFITGFLCIKVIDIQSGVCVGLMGTMHEYDNMALHGTIMNDTVTDV